VSEAWPGGAGFKYQAMLQVCFNVYFPNADAVSGEDFSKCIVIPQ